MFLSFQLTINHVITGSGNVFKAITLPDYDDKLVHWVTDTH